MFFCKVLQSIVLKVQYNYEEFLEHPMNINEHFLQLQRNYLFTEIANRTRQYVAEHPNNQLIKLGIGDITRPLAPAVIDAMHKAVDEQAHASTFHGYGLEEGYMFLREAIAQREYAPLGVSFSVDEIFISEGAGSDLGNISDIFSADNRVAIQDPSYPAYIDTTVMAGRAGSCLDGRWSDIVYIPLHAENHFIPELPKEHVDIIYLCYPNNPTGTALTKSQLQAWVNYALANNAVIIYDAAYKAFIQGNNIPHSIYEVPDAKRVAIEICSYSKTAGFTGVRCGYTVVPKELKDKQGHSLNPLWDRRQCTKYNGTSYISQRGAEAIYTAEGRQQVQANIDYYMGNATAIREQLRSIGLEVYGGEHAPYIWVRTPKGMTSWQYFDFLLNECEVVATPGVGFGPSGEGYLRLTAFGTHEQTEEALRRIAEHA